MTELAIETTSLRKEYGAKVAVADLTLAVPRGEVFGFLGPNGAGKSTSIKMLLGLVRATGGSARVLGRPPGDTPTLGRIGFLPEHFRFHDWLTARELLALHGRLERMEPAHCRKRTAEVLELVGLVEHADRPLSGFSKGMLQRIGIAQALLHSPELIFMDEPTSALDPFGRRLVRSIIQQVKAQGTTIFLNSHLLSEVEVTCDRVAFIRDGVVLQTLGLHEMQSGKQHLELRVDAVSPALLQRLAPLVDEWRFLDTDDVSASTAPGMVEGMSMPDGAGDGAPTALMLVTDTMRAPLIAQATLDAGAQLHALIPRHTSLEQLFLDVVGMEDSGQ
ncbi:MAG TPA: ABC transporter ATP-binding protein [Ktedonobacterales bacterium]